MIFCVEGVGVLMMRLVISIDLSPTGGMLATGSGDWGARLCEFFRFSHVLDSDVCVCV